MNSIVRSFAAELQSEVQDASAKRMAILFHDFTCELLSVEYEEPGIIVLHISQEKRGKPVRRVLKLKAVEWREAKKGGEA